MNTPILREARKISNEHSVECLENSKKLLGPTDQVTSVIFIRETNCVVVAGKDETIRIFRIDDSSTYPLSVFNFKEHRYAASKLAHLGRDLVASVGGQRFILTWKAKSGSLVGWIDRRGDFFHSVARIDSETFVTGTFAGSILFLKHENGKNLHIQHRIFSAHSRQITSIVADDAIMVSASKDESVAVWNIKSYELIKRLPHDDHVNCVAMNSNFIVTGCQDGKMFVFDRNSQVSTRVIMRGSFEPIRDISFIGNDVVLAASEDGYLNFISISNVSYIYRLYNTNWSDLTSVKLLNYNKLAICRGKFQQYGEAYIVDIPLKLSELLTNRV